MFFRRMTISLAVPDVLVARAKAGDLEALEALYRAFETPVYNLALRVLRRPEDAEDVLQETFLEVVRSIKQYRGEGHLWGWIRQIASSKALMRIRRNQVRATEELHEEAATGPGGGGSAMPARADLERAFERLSETSRAVVWLHDAPRATAGRSCAMRCWWSGVGGAAAGGRGAWPRRRRSPGCSCSGRSARGRRMPQISLRSSRNRRRSSSSSSASTPTPG